MQPGMEPDWILAAKSAPENVKFIDVNTEKESKLTKRFKVRGYPTILGMLSSPLWKYDSNTTAHILRTGAFPLASEDSCSYRRAPLHSAVMEWMKLKDSFLLISSSLDGRADQYFPITSTKVLFSLFPFLAEPAEPPTPPDEKSLTKQNRKEDSYFDSLKPSTHTLIIDDTPLTVCNPFENWIWDRLFAPATYLNPEMTEWLVARRAHAIFATIPDISEKKMRKTRQPKAEPAAVTQENQETGEMEGSMKEDEDAVEMIRKNCLKNTFTTENLNIRAIRPSHFSPTLTHRAYTLAALHLSYTANSLSTDGLMSSSQTKQATPFVSMNTQYYDTFTKYFLITPPSLLPSGTSNGPSTSFLPMVFVHDYSTKETWTDFGAFSLNWPSCVEHNAHVTSSVTRSPVGITEWTTTNDFSDNVAIMVLPSEDNQTSILDAASIDNTLQSSDASLLTPTPALLARIITQFVGDIRYGRIPSRVQVTPKSEKFENWLETHQVAVIVGVVGFLISLIVLVIVVVACSDDPVTTDEQYEGESFLDYLERINDENDVLKEKSKSESKTDRTPAPTQGRITQTIVEVEPSGEKQSLRAHNVENKDKKKRKID
ncbi:hypothetical protein BLNAU_9417 [Blattamonas nauphoetae]|uniref:FCP1 homology domain-containing protein n=1 Tax=Blattamonas nauphoetae TaxID=2049346 RepID=A0ABQ9XVQ3_9EUKA|nr:hypothetical protein BLNAU_9417 [Blattamonas nauphoetae]